MNNIFEFSIGEVVAWILEPFGILFRAVLGFALGAIGVEIV